MIPRKYAYLLFSTVVLLTFSLLLLVIQNNFDLSFEIVFSLIFFIVVIVSIGFWWINRIYNIRLRNQLYKTLQILEKFDIDEPLKVVFEKSPIPIFNELNDYLFELIKRIRKNYQANKQFTENASHELQTPLAIIKGNSELLIQSDKLDEKELEALGAIISSTNRLSKLNTALILLSKIEHQRFVDKEKVVIENVVFEVLKNFKDVIKLRNIEIKRLKPESIQFEMSATLIEITIANLVQNAIRHNIENGFIEISQKSRTLKISNPGKPLTIPKSALFKRFKRDSDIEESLGLGLSIVQRICKLYHIDIDYLYEGGIHTLKMTFPSNKDKKESVNENL